jgi:hypothetical protein
MAETLTSEDLAAMTARVRAMGGRPGKARWSPLTQAEALALLSAAERVEALGEALNFALSRLILQEPPDSRAVSDEFVAMAAVSAGIGKPEDLEIIRRALAKADAIAALQEEEGCSSGSKSKQRGTTASLTEPPIPAGKSAPRPNGGVEIGILNPYGDVWSYSWFETPEAAEAHLRGFWHNTRITEAEIRRFKLVGVSVTVEAISEPFDLPTVALAAEHRSQVPQAVVSDGADQQNPQPPHQEGDRE